MGILQRTLRFMVRATCGVQLTDGKRAMNLMLIVSLNEIVGHLVDANSVRWYGHV